MLAWYFLFIAPMNKEKIDLNARMSSAQAQLTDFSTTLAELEDFLRLQAELKNERFSLDSRLYAKEDIIRLFDQLKNQANQRNLAITEITPPVEELIKLNETVPDSTKPQFLTIGLRIEGAYTDFGRFVGDIEQAGYFRGINKCQISSGRKDFEKVAYSVTFKALLGRSGESS
jgi:Tfp pilus assembly protein PilO